MIETDSALASLLADCRACEISLLPTLDGGLTLDAPQNVLTPDLVYRLTSHKAEILELLASNPVSVEARQQFLDELVERTNAIYQDGPIDWLRLDAIEPRIMAAQTYVELLQETNNYRNEVVSQNDTGYSNQQRRT